LIYGELTSKYLKDFELNCIKIVSLAFTIKRNKSNYDELLVKLFENSLRYTKFTNIENLNLDALEVEKYNFEIEKLYLLDLAEMALWSDELLESNEKVFLNNLAIKLGIEKYNIDKSCSTINTFINEYKNEIPFFNYSNPVKHFYDQTNNTVTKLIKRNKKRLTKEIIESKELMILLAKSTTRELESEEKKKVKKQLLDICKTIPSLTIFLLPGGGILLPILIKYIPQLLPSAFNENLED
jgi:CRISPR/Cas system CSM-associated protein Csm2 small subunit